MRLVWCFLLSACLAAVHFDQANGCNVKSFGVESLTCVCSEELKCEGELSFLNEVSQEAGTVTSLLTGKDGPRFERSIYQFTTEANASVTANVEVEIDRTKKLPQKIMGFGGAFTDSTGYNIKRLPEALQTQLINDYFGSDGIEYRIGRVTIGGSDFSTRAYSNDDNATDETLSGFALQPEDLNYKLPFIHAAQTASRNQIRLFGSAWSAPAWMKTNKELNHGGYLKGEPGGTYYKAFAKYHVKFLQEYAKQNASLWGITVVNEPGNQDARPDFRYNSLSFPNLQAQRDYVKKDLGPELHAAGLEKVAVMIHDFNIDHIQEAAEAFFSDPEAAKFAAGSALHWYSRGSKYEVLQQILAKYPEKFILSTEASFDFEMPKSLGDWWRFNEVASDIIQVLNNGVVGWVDWNMVLDLKGGPSWVNDAEHPWHLDSPIHISDDGKEYYKVPTYYALGHFSKFVVPDSFILHPQAKLDEQAKNVLVNIAERPDKSIVLTVLNKNNHKVALKVHDPVRGYLQVEVDHESLKTMVWY